MTKLCKKCNTIKECTEFRTRGEGKNYRKLLYSHCKECEKKINAHLRELHKHAPTKSKSCNICFKETTRLMLDHDHETNKFRGWLCDNCNRGLSHLGDNIDGLMEAVKYLQKHSLTHKTP